MSQVKLNQSEVDVLSKLPEAQRAELEKMLLAAKAEAAAKLTLVRNEFTVSLSEFVKQQDGTVKPGSGGYKVTGLGSRFPVTLYPEQWEILFSNIEKIRACYNDPSNKAKSDVLRK